MSKEGFPPEQLAAIKLSLEWLINTDIQIEPETAKKLGQSKGEICGAFLQGFIRGIEAAQQVPDAASCTDCWCDTCANLENCPNPEFADGRGHPIQPPPCALCAEEPSKRQMPRENPPACGAYQERGTDGDRE